MSYAESRHRDRVSTALEYACEAVPFRSKHIIHITREVGFVGECERNSRIALNVSHIREARSLGRRPRLRRHEPRQLSIKR